MDTIEDTVREYYAALDEKRYDNLRSVLHPDVVHHRPDGTLDGREEFVEFMSEKRPVKNTTHEVETFFGTGPKVADGAEAAAVGRLVRDSTQETLFDFLDIFDFKGDDIKEIRTYTP